MYQWCFPSKVNFINFNQYFLCCQCATQTLGHFGILMIDFTSVGLKMKNEKNYIRKTGSWEN